jgi:deferrochelatase/peroxidase EfeB
MILICDFIACEKACHAGFCTACQGRSIRCHEPAFCGNLVDPQNAHDMRKFVWVGDEGSGWLHDGSYMVIRPIRIVLEHWDQMKTSFQKFVLVDKKLLVCQFHKIV